MAFSADAMILGCELSFLSCRILSCKELPSTGYGRACRFAAWLKRAGLIIFLSSSRRFNNAIRYNPPAHQLNSKIWKSPEYPIAWFPFKRCNHNFLSLAKWKHPGMLPVGIWSCKVASVTWFFCHIAPFGSLELQDAFDGIDRRSQAHITNMIPSCAFRRPAIRNFINQP